MIDWTKKLPPVPPFDAEAEARREEARKLLADTDWLIVRRAETGKSVKADILAAREAARKVLDR